MPLVDLQRRGRQIGEIRLGQAVPIGEGKTRPEKLSAFRFTTKSANVARSVADLHGGQATPIKLQNGAASWEVISEATELPVMVPPGDNVISQWYELWSAAGCQRRCDGETEQLTQSSCMCPSDPEARRQRAVSGGACKPTTRLNVMLPDLPDLGVWLLSSHGFNAAVELGGAAEVLAAARNSGVIVPATLRLEQREARKPGQQVKRFVVPVLEIGATLRQMTELQSNSIESALPPAPTSTKALGSGIETRDLSGYLRHAIGTPEERTRFRLERWEPVFDCATTAVPVDQVDAAMRLIDDHACQLNDIVDAELVEDLS